VPGKTKTSRRENERSVAVAVIVPPEELNGNGHEEQGTLLH
jgi:hypothetical protein